MSAKFKGREGNIMMNGSMSEWMTVWTIVGFWLIVLLIVLIGKALRKQSGRSVLFL